MALIDCIECGHRISELASKCVSCGAPISISLGRNASSTPSSVSSAESLPLTSADISEPWNALTVDEPVFAHGVVVDNGHRGPLAHSVPEERHSKPLPLSDSERSAILNDANSHDSLHALMYSDQLKTTMTYMKIAIFGGLIFLMRRELLDPRVFPLISITTIAIAAIVLELRSIARNIVLNERLKPYREVLINPDNEHWFFVVLGWLIGIGLLTFAWVLNQWSYSLDAYSTNIDLENAALVKQLVPMIVALVIGYPLAASFPRIVVRSLFYTSMVKWYMSRVGRT